MGKLTLAEPFEQIIPRELMRNGFQVLGLNVAHAAAVAALPFHHRDPFDRLLIAQAQVESLQVVSADASFDMYAVRRLW